jgi:hypothetical protein
LYSLAVVVELVVVVEMFVVKQSCKSLPSKMALKYFNATVPDDVDDGGDLDVDDDLMTAFVTAAVADVTAKRHNKFMSCEVALYKKSFCSFAMDESVDAVPCQLYSLSNIQSTRCQIEIQFKFNTSTSERSNSHNYCSNYSKSSKHYNERYFKRQR